MDEYKSVQKYLNKNHSKTPSTNKKLIFSYLNKILLSVFLLMITLCIIKVNPSFKELVSKYVYGTNFSFAKINDVYQKYLGDVLPISGLQGSKTEPVFQEQLVYDKKEDYKEGVKLTVDNNYLVPVLESGIVVFMGNKDNYGNVIIIQQVNDIDVWYVGVDSSNLKMYDYIEKGSLLGEAISNEIYLYYQKSGEFLDYKEYFS